MNRSLRSRFWPFWLLLSLALVACTPNRAYHTRAPAPDAPLCVAALPSGCANDVWYRVRAEAEATEEKRQPEQPVYLGFVEFDDQGALHDPSLKDAVINRIDALAQQQSVLMVVFAHGWKHNASADDPNVVDFANVLSRIAYYDEMVCAHRSCAGRQVIGVYLGWRGLSATTEPFKEISFYSRKSRAHRVGTDGAVEVLAQLAKIKAIKRTGQGNDNQLIVTGHSFGGALIYSAVQQQLVRDTAFPANGLIPRSSANLIALVNPAFEAARFATLERRARTLEHARNQRPILAVFTSRSDTATKIAFPLGRGLSTSLQQHVSKEQARQNRTALGHYMPFVTHDLDLKQDPAMGDDQTVQMRAFQDIGCDWQNFQFGATHVWRLGELELSRRPHMQQGSQAQNPIYNVSVDAAIIANHNAIWGETFSEFLYRFVAVQSLPAGRECP